MKFKVAQLENLGMFQLAGLIDLQIRLLKGKRCVFMVGCSRCGKSTLFNHINGIELNGVPVTHGCESDDEDDPFAEQKPQLEIVYVPRIINSKQVEANNGASSVTLLPNFVDKGDYYLVDFAGYLDKRRYNAVVSVSYALKAAFEVVQNCQFLLTLKNDDFKDNEKLVKSFRGFLNMFDFDSMSKETKEKLLKSVTLAITRSSPEGIKPHQYGVPMKKVLAKKDDQNYGLAQEVKKVSELMQFFVNNPQQIYLFPAAKTNEPAPPCNIFEEHIKNRQYFPLQQENDDFYHKNKRTLYHLPFAQDLQNMPIKADLQKMNSDISNRIKSFKHFANILQLFFLKAIDTKNLLDPNINFKNQFVLMKKFNTEFNIYTRQFDYQTETGLEAVFTNGNPEKKLKIGIDNAQNVFELYKLFNEWPEYRNEDDSSVLVSFMQEYKEHLVLIVDLFRKSFCTTWEEEQTILEFLFIAVRGCREFSMLYQFRPDGKHDMCLQLKDSFEAIMESTPLSKIQLQFVKQLYENIEDILKLIGPNLDQLNKYLKYFRKLEQQESSADIKSSKQYKQLVSRFVEQIPKLNQTPERRLHSTYKFLLLHIQKVKGKLNQFDDEEGQSYPEELNFTFVYLLAIIGNLLLNFERQNDLKQDHFAYDRSDVIRGALTKNQTIKQFLMFEQVDLAMDIFIYIQDVESLINAYEIVLKNIPESDHNNRRKYMEGMADYCLKSGRIEQGILNYQKLLKLCAEANLCKEYQGIKQILSEIPINKEEKLKNYFNELKHKRIIDPSDDRDLDIITERLQTLFINPYENKDENQLE